MMIFAHPDEGEVYTGGTAALFTQLGHQVKFMSLTNGDAGHWEEKPEVLAKRRYQEAMNAKKILNLAEYEVLDYHDQGLKNTKESRAKVTRSIQAFKPDIVFTYYPAMGGHIDNMTAGYIVRDAVRDLKMEKLPVFLYVRDYHTSSFTYIPHFAFSIDKVWETKLEACGAHQTQVAEALDQGQLGRDVVVGDRARHRPGQRHRHGRVRQRAAHARPRGSRVARRPARLGQVVVAGVDGHRGHGRVTARAADAGGGTVGREGPVVGRRGAAAVVHHLLDQRQLAGHVVVGDRAGGRLPQGQGQRVPTRQRAPGAHPVGGEIARHPDRLAQHVGPALTGASVTAGSPVKPVTPGVGPTAWSSQSDTATCRRRR